MTGQHLMTTEAVFRGELGRMLMALGVVLLIMMVIWAIEEWRNRAVTGIGLAALSLAGFSAAALVSVGLL